MNSRNLRSVTSSPALADGRSLCGGLDGLTKDLFGQDHALASHSAQTEGKKGFRMKGTFGLPGETLSPSDALQQSLESRLQANLNGSDLCEVIWVKWVTPWLQSRSRPLARVRTIGGKDIGLLHPTPLAGSTSPAAHNAMSGTWKTAIAKLTSGSRLSTEGSSAINPAYPTWLMGYPEEVLNCAPSGTR